MQRRFDVRAALEPAERERRRFQRREALAARLATQLAVERRPARAQHQTLRFQHPWVAPPQRLRLAPGAVEDDDAVDAGESRVLVGDRLALLVDDGHLTPRRNVGGLRRAQMQDGPAARIGGTAEGL